MLVLLMPSDMDLGKACVLPRAILPYAWVSLTMSPLDIITNNKIDQKVVEISSSQHYSLVEHSIYRSVFPPQGV